MRRSIRTARPVQAGCLPSIAAHDVLGGMRQRRAACRSCSCTAGRAAAACRITAASTILRSGASCSTTSAAPGARRPLAELDGQHDRAPRRRHRAAARASRHRPLAAVRRLVGLDAGAAYAQAHPERVLGLVLRGVFLATRARDRLVHARHARRLSRGVARVRGVPAAGRARRPARQLLSPPDRSRSGRAPAGGARVGPLRERVLDAAAASRTATAASTATPAALAIARIEAHYFVHDAFLEPRRSCSRTCAASAICPARSSRAATTSSARRSPPTRSRARGPRPSTSSCPTPATRCASRASRASSSPPCSRMQDGCRRASAVSARRCRDRRNGRRAAAPPSGIRARR